MSDHLSAVDKNDWLSNIQIDPPYNVILNIGEEYTKIFNDSNNSCLDFLNENMIDAAGAIERKTGVFGCCANNRQQKSNEQTFAANQSSSNSTITENIDHQKLLHEETAHDKPSQLELESNSKGGWLDSSRALKVNDAVIEDDPNPFEQSEGVSFQVDNKKPNGISFDDRITYTNDEESNATQFYGGADEESMEVAFEILATNELSLERSEGHLNETKPNVVNIDACQTNRDEKISNKKTIFNWASYIEQLLERTTAVTFAKVQDIHTISKRQKTNNPSSFQASRFIHKKIETEIIDSLKRILKTTPDKKGCYIDLEKQLPALIEATLKVRKRAGRNIQVKYPRSKGSRDRDIFLLLHIYGMAQILDAVWNKRADGYADIIKQRITDQFKTDEATLLAGNKIIRFCERKREDEIIQMLSGLSNRLMGYDDQVASTSGIVRVSSNKCTDTEMDQCVPQQI